MCLGNVFSRGCQKGATFILALNQPSCLAVSAIEACTAPRSEYRPQDYLLGERAFESRIAGVLLEAKERIATTDPRLLSRIIFEFWTTGVNILSFRMNSTDGYDSSLPTDYGSYVRTLKTFFGDTHIVIRQSIEIYEKLFDCITRARVSLTPSFLR